MPLPEPLLAEAPELDPEPAPPALSRTVRRLGVAGLVLAAALGGLGVGMAWASDDDPAPPSPAPADVPAEGCGGGQTNTSVL
jgi:hypothetical protein